MHGSQHPLVGGAAAAAVQVHASCKTYVSKGLIQTAVGTLQDVMVVQAS
jgi:hypothetical protein